MPVLSRVFLIRGILDLLKGFAEEIEKLDLGFRLCVQISISCSAMRSM